jgi:RNA polymerase sigma-70 factor (ECF subfamily)
VLLPDDDLETVFVSVVRAESARMTAYVAAIVGRREAEEVVAEAVARAYRALPSFRGDGPLEAWMLRIARSAAIDHVRRARRRPRTTDEPGVDDEMFTVAGGGADVDLQLLVDALPLDTREALVLTRVMGCSYEEAAAVLDVPVGTVRSRVFRARRQLVAALEESSTPPGSASAERSA